MIWQEFIGKLFKCNIGHQSWRLQKGFYHENCIFFINYWVIQTKILTTPKLLPSTIFGKRWFSNSFIPSTHLPALTDLLHTPVCAHDRHFFHHFSKYLSKLSLENGLALKTCILSLKTADTSRNGVCFYVYSSILITFTTVQFLVSLSYEHSKNATLYI